MNIKKIFVKLYKYEEDRYSYTKTIGLDLVNTFIKKLVWIHQNMLTMD